jgi:holo-[acyl-carrier protein] synthase
LRGTGSATPRGSPPEEAAFKVLRTGRREGIRWVDVSVTHRSSGKPELVLKGRAQALAQALRVAESAVSISHADRYAMALVVFERNE